MPAANVILLLTFYSFATRHSYEKGIQELSSVWPASSFTWYYAYCHAWNVPHLW